MELYNLYAGMGGSFGGAEYRDTVEFKSLEEAEREAYCLACEVYECYEGLHGIKSEQDILEEYCEENGLSESELDNEDYIAISEECIEEREGWLCYYAIPASEDPNTDEINN